jgi:hypothetical protein
MELFIYLVSLFAATTPFQIQNSLHAMVKQFVFTAVDTTVGRINVVFFKCVVERRSQLV